VSLFRRAAERRGTPAELLVVGLGNPGKDYAGTRHNVGAEVVELLARRHGGVLRSDKKQRSLVDVVDIGGHRVVLALPQTYMNLSGEAVRELVLRNGITDPHDVVVVHDELDLPVGRIKAKRGGGNAGHNGLKSVSAHMGTDDYARVRIGVAKPPSAGAGRGHVLGRPGTAEGRELDIQIERAADAVEVYLEHGIDDTMNRFNSG
jgi:peptidyl-tRNA hydrolase, PTH1 family